ncbi:hypothetical protein M409DRAFT_49265 [Zasmidium cellare ATCC 36951]|uniref:F-box domain-containing protein n=1 Tax=Zasmidium cellare ATCC 36951 TaxID=1080233 RepID=A0A6A6D2S7_ZASCE|nr:uncharacterized protein M409DRAFT_49265 [Zasmidium cellare ATCC 36951]KAF2172728.1 hypothetical protein M409DRAFT_49265 [Zasmidium cellare ATCC 36951]
MDAPPTLATLPAELQKEIAEALHYEDVIAFRQVSRDMRAASEDAFLTLHFGERHYVFSRYGLTRLAEYTSHPHLTKKLWNIRIIVVDPAACATSSETHTTQRPESIDSDSDEEVDRDEPASRGSEIKRLESAWQPEMTDLTNDDLDIHLLALTMHNLRAASQEVAFCVTGSIGDDVAPGMAIRSDEMLDVLNLEGSHQFVRRGSSGSDCSRIMNSLFKAAARTGFSFSHLELCEDPDRGTFTSEALDGLCSLDMERLCHSWESLSSLMIGFAHGQERWFVDRDNGLGALIASATNITSLFLYNDGMYDEHWEGSAAFDDSNPLSWLGKAFANHRLHHLRLGGFYGRADQFAKVLRGHHQTLKEVELLGVQIQGHECWSSVLQVVLTDLDLNDLNICGLMKMPDMYEEVIFPDGKDRLSVDKPEAIKELISQMLAQGVQYKDIDA